MIANRVPNFPSLFFQVFCLKFPPVYKLLLILSMCGTCTPCPFSTKIKPSKAFYQRIKELWCHAKNFPNDPRISKVDLCYLQFNEMSTWIFHDRRNWAHTCHYMNKKYLHITVLHGTILAILVENLCINILNLG